MVLVQKVRNERCWHDPGIWAHLALSSGLCHCFFAAVFIFIAYFVLFISRHFFRQQFDQGQMRLSEDGGDAAAERISGNRRMMYIFSSSVIL